MHPSVECGRGARGLGLEDACALSSREGARPAAHPWMEAPYAFSPGLARFEQATPAAHHRELAGAAAEGFAEEDGGGGAVIVGRVQSLLSAR